MTTCSKDCEKDNICIGKEIEIRKPLKSDNKVGGNSLRSKTNVY